MLKLIREESCKMIKEDMIATVARETGYNRQAVTDIIETMLANIIRILMRLFLYRQEYCRYLQLVNI